MNTNYINLKIDEYLNKSNIQMFNGEDGISLSIDLKQDKLFKNLEAFTIPDKAFHDLFKNTVNLCKQYIKDCNLNFDRNYFYIKSTLISSNKPQPHMFAPDFKNTFFGIVNLSSLNLTVQILKSTIELPPGEIKIFNSEDKINLIFKENQRALSFNVSSFEFLDLQQPNTWLPIV